MIHQPIVNFIPLIDTVFAQKVRPIGSFLFNFQLTFMTGYF